MKRTRFDIGVPRGRGGGRRRKLVNRLLKGELVAGRFVYEEFFVNGAPLERPEYLTGNAAKVWDEVAPGLIECRFLDELNVTVFVSYCILQNRVYDHPDLVADRQVMTELRMQALTWGLTPEARQRLEAQMS